MTQAGLRQGHWERKETPDGGAVYRRAGVYGWFGGQEACQYQAALEAGTIQLQYPVVLMPAFPALSSVLTEKPPIPAPRKSGSNG